MHIFASQMSQKVASAKENTTFWTSLIVLMIYANLSFIQINIHIYMYTCMYVCEHVCMYDRIYILVKAEQILLLVKLL